MSKRYELRRGDTCPCCGQRIETDDPFVLSELAAFAKQMERTASGRVYLSAIGFAWPEDDDGEG